MSPVRVAAIVLAAGRGGRMGGLAKATLRLPDGRTFVEAIVATARAAGAGTAAVVVAAPHEAESRSAAEAAGADLVVTNPDPARGMLSSLLCGIAALPAGFDAVLSWPVDHPAVGRATIERIVERASKAGIVVPTHERRGGHPTAFGLDLADELAAALASGDDARRVLRARPKRVVRIAVDDPGTVRDVDRPSDLSEHRR